MNPENTEQLPPNEEAGQIPVEDEGKISFLSFKKMILKLIYLIVNLNIKINKKTRRFFTNIIILIYFFSFSGKPG